MFVPNSVRAVPQRDEQLLAELASLRELGPNPRLKSFGRRASAPALPSPPVPARPPRERQQPLAPLEPAPAPAPPPYAYGPVHPDFQWDRKALGDVDDITISPDGALAGKSRGVLWRVVQSSGAVPESTYWEVVIESAYPKALDGKMKEPTLFIGVCLPSLPSKVDPTKAAAGWFFSVETGSVFHAGFQRRLARRLSSVRKLGATFGLRLTQPSGMLELFLEGELLGIAFERVPPGVHAACGLYLLGETARIVSPPYTRFNPPALSPAEAVAFAAPSRGLHRASTFKL